MSNRLVLAAFLLLGPTAGLTAPLAAQQPSVTERLNESRRRLDSIRAERERLEQQRRQLESQVKDVGAELRNIERQRETTNRIVNEIESQIGGLNTQVDRISAELVLAQNNLLEKRAVLQRRLVEIYQRGPLYTFQALLAAESFSDLLTRYKYLYLTSRQDRALVEEVELLRDRVIRQRNELLGIRTSLDRTREDREVELRRYANLANARERRLTDLRRSGQSTAQMLTKLERDEQALVNLLAELERARLAAARRGGGAPVPGGLTTADIGTLDWPVEGRVLYSFGRETLPSGVVIRRNGIGIGAAAGTPVKAVEAGRVELVSRLQTYGLTIVVQHGNGYRSLYMQLAEARVAVGQDIQRGQVIATVGGGNTDEGPHLYFEIRGDNAIALDPTDWLRQRR